ncbi:amidohydrolase [Salinicoccus halitifaciens]|uniref:Amidohydrolase YtcJ n=1 Tax=Salinicoccus halitifaciens TaxID=1073415 RepID=A0ABV2E9X2_9STAP|nr:amidohydrolase [Salinicoccus halitifaciens]MCD2138356.1 amidohydrolase [Salinicoccus halitifaciens]
MKTLYKNGRIYSMASHDEVFESILTEDGRVIAVDPGDVDADRVIDLGGGAMLPGLNDTHLHLVMVGKRLKSLVLYDEDDVDRVKELIKNHSSDRKWDMILGYDENNFKDAYRINRHELDELTDKPTLIARVCQHAGIVNTKALEALGIDASVEDPEGGSYERDENGELTGWVYDTAFDKFRAAQVEDTIESVSDDITVAVEHLYTLGVTGVHTEDMAYYGENDVPLNAYLNTIGEDALKFRVNLLRHESVYEEMVEKDPKYKKDWVEKDAMKIFADGAFGGRTALMKEPYEDSDESGLRIHKSENLGALVQKARRNGDAVAVHVIGDRAVEMVLDAIEKYPAPEGLHDRLIHVSLLDEDLIERMSRLSVICDVQPTFLTSDMPWVEDYIGEERAARLYNFKTMQDNGLLLGGGSDAPIEDVNPLPGIHALVTREGKTGVYNEGERVGVFQAFQMYTKNAAEIVYRGDRSGLIKEGYYADFAVFDRDVMNIEADELLEAEVLYTIIEDEVVYQKGGI